MEIFITVLIFSLIFSNYFEDSGKILFFLFFLNLVVEFDFLRFAMKYFKKKNILMYMIGIFLTKRNVGEGGGKTITDEIFFSFVKQLKEGEGGSGINRQRQRKEGK